MFGLWQSKNPAVIKQWYSVVTDFEMVPSDFYGTVEKEIASQQIAGLAITRMERSEGGPLSPRRLYLRLRRERLVFDVCSAPFGTAWLFSCRFSEIPVSMRVWELLLLLLLLGSIVYIYLQFFGLIFGSVLCAASFLSVLLLLRNTFRLGLDDLDSALLQVPVFGACYESWFRRDTYYRDDSRHAYLAIVNAVIRQSVLSATKDKGVEGITFVEIDPPPPRISMIQALWNFFRPKP